jgi:SET domain-containing protein
MFVVRVELKPSAIHGFGCFAAEFIKKDQLVWQFDPRVDITIPVEQYNDFPPAVQEMFDTWTYVEEQDGVEVMVLCGDFAKFINHSDRPNLYLSEDGSKNFAARDISIGEEITCDYFGFDKDADVKLGTAPA